MGLPGPAACNRAMFHTGRQIVYTQKTTVTGLNMTPQAGEHGVSFRPDLQDLLTIVIPTYNRHRLLNRALAYWAGVPVRVLVMDGGAQPLPEADQARMGARITYVHEPALLIQRLGRAGRLIETPFVTMIGDDEFHLHSGLGASVSALQDDADLVACMGRVMGFSLLDNGALGARQVYLDFSDHAIDQNTACARMLGHFARYTPSTIYSVVRTPVWRQALGASLEQEFPIFASAEIQIELALSAIGKSRVLPVLHWLRSYENTPIRNTGEVTLTSQTRFHQWWQDADARDQQQAFVQTSARHIARATREPESRIFQGIWDALNAYVQFVGQMAWKQAEYQRRMNQQIGSARDAPVFQRSWRGMQAFQGELSTLAKCGVTFNEAEIHAVASAIHAYHG